jgi:FdrA protein
MIQHLEVRRGEYRDSVTLMLATRAVAALPGVAAALVAMGTELNLELLRGLGYRLAEPAGINDLIVAFSVAADDGGGDADAGAGAGAHAGAAGLAALEAALSSGSVGPVSAGDPAALAPRTVGSALRRTGGSLALISTPGPAAAVECMDALEANASAIVFSDNVPLHHELRLKNEAHRRGLLVMGPDCGTVVLGGVGYGFANVVRPGPVSLVAASGTGAQQVMALLDAAGVGTRHCLGVGGRDLSAAIAGRSTLDALTALDADPDTELIVLVAKPPDPAVAALVRQHAATLATPVLFALVGAGLPDLTAAVGEVLRVLGRGGGGVSEGEGIDGSDENRGTQWAARAGHHAESGTTGATSAILGLFSGGTLCAEAQVIVAAAGLDTGGLTDFGDDAYTRGRPHPMIDNTLRLGALATATADATAAAYAAGAAGPATATAEIAPHPAPILLLDVVLGRGAHPDPSAELAPAVAAAVEAGLSVVVSLCGTVGDPQGLARQAGALAGAGASVFRSNAAAARAAVRLATEPPFAPSEAAL